MVHTPDYAVSLFGLRGISANMVKAELGTAMLGLAVYQLVLALWIYGRLPGVGPGAHFVHTAHRAGGILVFLGLFSLGLLGLADLSMAGNGSPDVGARAQWAWDRGDHLHYAVHILAGRVLDLCPCTRRAADAQYYYARFHAVTPRQRDVVSNTPIDSTQMQATAIPRNEARKMLRRAVCGARYREKSAAYGAQLRGIEAARIVMKANPTIPLRMGA